MVESELLEFIRSEIGNDRTAELTPDDQLLEGALDSVDILKLVVFVEGRYAIEFEDDELVPESFETVAILAALVRMKVTPRSETLAAG